MPDGGYIKTFREIRDWQFWDKPRHAAIWWHLLIDANWKDHAWKHGKPLKRGELLISMRIYAESCGVNKDTLKAVLKDFEEAGQITIKPSPEGTRIQIINYEEYQDGVVLNSDTNSDTQSDSRSDTNSDKSETSPYLFNRRNKEKKKERILMANPTLDQIREYIYTENLMVDPDTFFDYYESQGWKLSNGNKMKDWKASCRNWHRKEVEKMNKEKKGVLPF